MLSDCQKCINLNSNKCQFCVETSGGKPSFHSPKSKTKGKKCICEVLKFTKRNKKVSLNNILKIPRIEIIVNIIME